MNKISTSRREVFTQYLVSLKKRLVPVNLIDRKGIDLIRRRERRKEGRVLIELALIFFFIPTRASAKIFD